MIQTTLDCLFYMNKQDNHSDSIKFFITDDYYLLIKNDIYLIIDRPDGLIHITAKSPSLKSFNSNFLTIFGVIGMVHFLSNPYLIVITERDPIGSLLGGFVWKIKSTRIFPLFNKPVNALTPEQVLLKVYLRMMMKKDI